MFKTTKKKKKKKKQKEASGCHPNLNTLESPLSFSNLWLSFPFSLSLVSYLFVLIFVGPWTPFMSRFEFGSRNYYVIWFIYFMESESFCVNYNIVFIFISYHAMSFFRVNICLRLNVVLC